MLQMSLLRQQNLSVLILIAITSITTILTQQQQQNSSCNYKSFPFIVNLIVHASSNSFCSGSLIAPRWVLTAAHCSRLYPSNQISVRTPQSRKQRCHKIYPHPSFDEKTVENDISLLLLRGDLSAERYATLPVLGFTDQECHRVDALGWEHNHLEEKDSYNLNLFCARGAVKLDARSKVCTDTIPVSYFPSEKIVCVSSDANGLHPCRGDSGGPLVCNSSVVVGVVSFGYYCDSFYGPTIYTRVEEYREFFSEVLVETGSELKKMMGMNGSSVFYVSGSRNKSQGNLLFIVFLQLVPFYLGLLIISF